MPRGRTAPAKPAPQPDVEPTPAPQPTAEPAPTLRPTSARAWNSQALYTLPSGHVARLKRPGVLAAAVATNGYNPVSDAVLMALQGVAREKPTTDAELAASIRANGRVFLEYAALCFVSPRIVLDREPDYDNDEIAGTDLEDPDLVWVFYEFGAAEVSDLVHFRAPESDPDGADSSGR